MVHTDSQPSFGDPLRFGFGPLYGVGSGRIERTSRDDRRGGLEVAGRNPECFQARFSPNDRWICVSSLPGPGIRFRFGIGGVETLLYRVGKPATEYAFDFSPDSRQLAIGHEDGSVSLHDLVTFRQIAEFQVASAPITVAFHPTKPLLAVNCRLAYCTQLWALTHPPDAFSAAPV